MRKSCCSSLLRHLLTPLLLFVFGDVASAAKNVAVKETVFDSAVVDIVWLTESRKTVLLRTVKGRIYRSTNEGDAWSDVTEKLKNLVDSTSASTMFITNLKASPADKNTVLITGSKGNHFVSTDAGENWRRLRQKSQVHTFIFHKTRATWALMSTWTQACDPKNKEELGDDPGPCTHMLYITKDMGRTFNLVASYVVQFSWGAAQHGQQDRIYFTHFRKKSGDQEKLALWSKGVDFAYTDDVGQKVTRLVYRGNKFLLSSGFIFVAKLKDATAQTVTLMVSSDGGNNFKPAQLPQELDEKSYTILDASEGAVMLHVNHGDKDGSFNNVGNVYISDADGVRFSLSLPNNVRGSSGDCEFDKMVSMEGTYMANFRDVEKSGEPGAADASAADKEDQTDETASETAVDKRRSARSGKEESVVRTVVTFDKGGVWSYLKPPKVDSTGKAIDCPADRCWLHLHGVTNFNNYAPFYSIEQAVGLIMGTGNVGSYLRYETDQVNTYLSRDGGLSWAECHKGAYIYEFGDHGGLVLMANVLRKTKQVVFSWNEGQSWYDFDVSETPLEVDNIVTEPNATSTKFLMYGTRGDSGVVYHLDFDALGQPLCKGVWAADSVSSDYETWTPSDGKQGNGDKCLLGRTVTYTRRKQTSECFNGEQFERPVTRKNCACTEADFECEMGFTRKVGADASECRMTDEGLAQVADKVALCTSSGFYMATAYRKVVGDTCEGGYVPQQVAVPCPANSRLSDGARGVLGTVGTIVVIMGVVTFLSRSEAVKGMFSNYGFENFNSVKYAQIGARGPESALDSVVGGSGRFDDDFMEGEDDYGSPPQLMSYNSGSDRREETRIRPGGVETAAAAVPKLAAPPAASGGGGAADDGVDLL